MTAKTRGRLSAPTFALFRACAKSAIRSSTCSSPTLTRMRPSEYPAGRALLIRQRPVGHACEMLDERLRPAEAHRQRRDLDGFKAVRNGSYHTRVLLLAPNWGPLAEMVDRILQVE